MTKREHEIRYEPHGAHGPEVVCACGWRKHHPRAKVRNAAAGRHLIRAAARSAS